MPNTLTGALVFAILVVPGYQLVRGYAVARGDAPPATQLYVLGQAVTASLAWLALTWPFVTDLLHWISSDTVSEHVLASYAIAPLLIGTPYLVGRHAGRLVRAITREQDPIGPYWLWRLAHGVGLVENGTPWDRLWLKATDLRPLSGDDQDQVALITVALDDGSSLHGQFGAQSRVVASPAEPSVYFERAYETDAATGEVRVYPGGAHVDGKHIVAVKLESWP
jgi:hypothetical protein